MFLFGSNPVAESATNQLAAIEMACQELGISYTHYDSYDVVTKGDDHGRYVQVKTTDGRESKKYYYSR